MPKYDTGLLCVNIGIFLYIMVTVKKFHGDFANCQTTTVIFCPYIIVSSKGSNGIIQIPDRHAGKSRCCATSLILSDAFDWSLRIC